MTFFVQYAEEYSRVIAGIVLEVRQTLDATKNKSGFEVFDFYTSEIEKVMEDVIPYKLETESGNLAAYFSVKVTGNGGALYQKFVRPNFRQFDIDISQKINSFIFNNDWKQDFLFGELK